MSFQNVQTNTINGEPYPPSADSRVYQTIDFSGYVSPIVYSTSLSSPIVEKTLDNLSGSNIVYYMKNFQDLTGVLDGSGNQVIGYSLVLPSVVNNDHQIVRVNCIDNSLLNAGYYPPFVTSLSGEMIQLYSSQSDTYFNPLGSSNLTSLSFESIESENKWLPIADFESR